MKLPFISHSPSKSLDSNSSLQSWPWPVCANIKTLSFRASNDEHNPFRTFNSAFIDTPPDSFFTFSSSSRSFSSIISEDSGDPIESFIHTLRSDRLFFDPHESSSLVDRQKYEKTHDNEDVNDGENNEKMGYKESEILSVDSNNPYDDFRRSMEEMVEAHGLKDWNGLEELLGCYLKINGCHNHGFIVGAFIDLLVSLSLINSSTNSTSSSSSSSLSMSSSSILSSSLSSTTPCLSSILDHHHDGVDGVGKFDHDDSDDGHV